MKLIFRIIIIALFTYLMSFYFPWWVGMVIAGVVSILIYSSGISAIIAGFLGVGSIWFGYSFFLDNSSNSFFSEKIVELFPFNDPVMLIVLSGIIGGVSGGFGALAGHTFKGLFVKKKSKSLYS
ncbi:MAG: hypothetical protein ACJA0X_000380 [Cyclobacteriaceae bacterium]|jgi:hypothetical protein